MFIDTSVGFGNIGGLGHYVHALKEMIVFPLMYPEVVSLFYHRCSVC
jgi:hypothetical protein